MGRRRSHLWVALLVSLGLHAAVAVWMTLTPAPPPPKTSQAIELEVHWLEAKAPPPPAPAPPKPMPAAAPLPRPASAKVAVSEAAPKKAPSEGTPTTAAPSTGGATDNSPLRFGDVPLAQGPTLTPGLGAVLRMPEASDAEGPHGETLHNDPTEQPDPLVMQEYRGEVMARKLNADLARDVASAKAGAGGVPMFFARARTSMRAAVEQAPPQPTPSTAGDTARNIARIALTPGISAEAARKVTDTPLGRSISNNTVPLPNIEDQRFREGGLQLMAQLEAVKERVGEVRLRTVVEVTVDASGGVAEASILEKSGDSAFDESALHLSRKVMRDLPDSDEKGLGTNWWTSRWQFTWEPPVVRVKLLEARELQR